MDLVKSDIDRYFDYLSDKEKELVCMGDMVFEKLPEVIRDFGEALQAGCMSAQNISEPEGGDKNEKEEVSAQGMEMILRDKDKEVVMCEGKGKELVVREEGGEVRIRGGEDQSMMVVGEDGGNEEVNGNRRRGRPKTDLNVWPKWLPWNWIINNVTRTGGRSAGHVDRNQSWEVDCGMHVYCRQLPVLRVSKSSHHLDLDRKYQDVKESPTLP
ncbi:hypothetical protein Ancab_007294 [Ancistrocladus abbreviatus]